MKKTFTAKKNEIEKKWYILDAKGQTLGKVAVLAADILRGKKKSIFSPHIDTGDYIIIINIEKIRVSGNKGEGKKYYWHSWYPGGLKVKTFNEAFEKNPKFVIEHAVSGMLPKNRLQDDFLKKLKLYIGEKHEHEAQKPIEISISQ